jgi:hypothetical protein
VPVNDISQGHRDGPCTDCGRKGFLYKGRCVPCNQPPDRRQLVEAGVPCGSADALAQIAQRCGGGTSAQKVLEMAHPVLMENIVVDKDGTMRLKSTKYHWVRRQGWSS